MAFYFALFNVSNSNRELRDQLHQLHAARRSSKQQNKVNNRLQSIPSDADYRGAHRERRRHSVASMNARRRSSDLAGTSQGYRPLGGRTGMEQPLRIVTTADSPATSTTWIEDSPISRLDVAYSGGGQALRRLSSPEVSPRLPSTSFSPRFHYNSDGDSANNNNSTSVKHPSRRESSGSSQSQCCPTPPLINYKLSPPLSSSHISVNKEVFTDSGRDSLKKAVAAPSTKRVTFMSGSATASNLADYYRSHKATEPAQTQSKGANTGNTRQGRKGERKVDRRMSFDFLDLGNLTAWNTKAVVIPDFQSGRSKGAAGISTATTRQQQQQHSSTKKGGNSGVEFVEIVSPYSPLIETLRSSELTSKTRGRSGQAEIHLPHRRHSPANIPKHLHTKLLPSNNSNSGDPATTAKYYISPSTGRIMRIVQRSQSTKNSPAILPRHRQRHSQDVQYRPSAAGGGLIGYPSQSLLRRASSAADSLIHKSPSRRQVHSSTKAQAGSGASGASKACQHSLQVPMSRVKIIRRRSANDHYTPSSCPNAVVGHLCCCESCGRAMLINVAKANAYRKQAQNGCGTVDKKKAERRSSLAQQLGSIPRPILAVAAPEATLPLCNAVNESASQRIKSGNTSRVDTEDCSGKDGKEGKCFKGLKTIIHHI